MPKNIKSQTIKNEYLPTERQKQAHSSLAKYILYGGAVGGGKTRVLCEEVKQLALDFPGNNLFIGRYSFEDLKKTTLVELERVLPEVLISQWHKQDKKITLVNGSIINYGDCQDPDKVKSMELGAAFIDEASQITENFFNILCTRLRHKLPNKKRPYYRIMLASNPEPCWLVDKFVRSTKKEFEFIPALPKDNPHLPDDYIDTLRSVLPEAVAQKYVEGSWDDLGIADCVIQPKDIAACKNIQPSINTVYRIISCDVARFGDDKTVIMCIENGRIIKKKIMQKVPTTTTAYECKKMHKELEAYGYVIDSDGVGGGVTDNLNMMGEKNVIEFHGNSKPFDEFSYYNLKTECWFNLQKALEDRMHGIGDDYVENELTTLKYKYLGGKLITESKAEYKKRIGKSSDEADCYIMGHYAQKFCMKPEDKKVFYVPEKHRKPVARKNSYGW